MQTAAHHWNRIAGLIGAILVGIAGVGAVAAIIWSLAASYTRDQINAERYTTHYAESASQEIQERCAPLNPILQRNCIKEIVESTHENQRDEADLNAQREMANWAYAMVVISGFSFLLTVAGIYFVRENLLEMQETRKVSQDAVKAANEANEVARHVGQAQVCAYLHCTGGSFVMKADYLQCQPILVNTGQSPASNIRIKAIGVLRVQNQAFPFNPIAPTIEIVRTKEATGHCEVIPGGSSKGTGYILWPHTDVGTEIQDSLINDEPPFSFNCHVTWTDVFEDEHIALMFLDSEFSRPTYDSDGKKFREGTLDVFNQYTMRMSRNEAE